MQGLEQNDIKLLRSLIAKNATFHFNQGPETTLDNYNLSNLVPLVQKYIKEFGRYMDHVREGDNWAVEHAHFTSKVLENGSQTTAHYQGKYNLLWQKDDVHNWRIAKISCIFNRPISRPKVA